MNTLMKYVKKIEIQEGCWHSKLSDWSYDSCMNLWQVVNNHSTMLGSMNKGNRRHELSWKTVYNQLCKNNGLKASGIVTEVTIENQNDNRASSNTLPATMPALQIRNGNRVSTSTCTSIEIRNDNRAINSATLPATMPALQI